MRSVVDSDGTIWECRTLVEGVRKSTSPFLDAAADRPRDHAVVACRASDRITYLDLPMDWERTLEREELQRLIGERVAKGAVYPVGRDDG